MKKTRSKPTKAGSRSNGERRASVKKAPPPQFKQKDLSHFRSLLEGMRDETVREIDTLTESLAPEVVTIGEQPDEPPSSVQTVLMIHRQRRLLHSVENALLRIDQGTYGKCSSCGKPIERGRLEAIPDTTLCVECGKEKQD
jgi:DnaK suppressor protein